EPEPEPEPKSGPRGSHRGRRGPMKRPHPPRRCLRSVGTSLMLATTLAAGLAAGLDSAHAAPPPLPAAPATATTHAPFVVSGVELHVGDGRVIPNATLVVRDGRF